MPSEKARSFEKLKENDLYFLTEFFKALGRLCQRLGGPAGPDTIRGVSPVEPLESQ